MIHLVSPPVNNRLHLGAAGMTHLDNAPVNDPLHLGVADTTHLAKLPVNKRLHLWCSKSDTSCQPTCKRLFTPPVLQI